MSDSSKVLSQLRQWIIEGELAPGEKLAEIPMAERLGVSRTPVRLAFRTLEQEGLLTKRPSRGFEVRRFTGNDIQGGLEVRGALEGIAARRVAERGLAEHTLAALQQCLQAGEALLAKGHLVEDDIDTWGELNGRFHQLIIDACDCSPVAEAIARNNHLPFASVNSLIIDTKALDREYRKLSIAQVQHQALVDALRLGEGARAESLMREHAYIGFRYSALFSPSQK